MNEQDYQKVFDHFIELSQRYALGKVQHDELYEGLKKLMGEVIEVEVQVSRRRQRAAFLRFLLVLFILIGAGSAFFLWRHGFFHSQPKASQSKSTPSKQNHHKAK
jgi:hypothetical protein